MGSIFSSALQLWRSLLGAIIFYTVIPIPAIWQPSFYRIARWSPFVGILVGGILAIAFWGLTLLDSPILLKSVILTALWLGLTGGLHLDGAMDSADGLATTNPERRLEVMADSASGAFGVMSAIIILLLKVAAISALPLSRWWLLPLTLAWGRWSQVTAIAFYPYLKPAGKGALHKKDFHIYQDLPFSLLPILCTSLSFLRYPTPNEWQHLVIFLIGLITAVGTNKWFQLQFQGHTGDTYGATVEWTEVTFLNLVMLFFNRF